MASYMPSFMSKNLSTGAEAANGQPFAFTTGAKGKTASGSKPTSGKEKKANQKKKKLKKVKAATEKPPDKKAATEKPPDKKAAANKQHDKYKLRIDDIAAMKKIKLEHLEARMTAFNESTDSASLTSKLRAANAVATIAKIGILKQYYAKSADGTENAKIKRLEKEVEYYETTPTKNDSRTFSPEAFTEFKKIYATFYESQFAAMRSLIVTQMRQLMKDAVAQKNLDLNLFYTKYPELKAKPRAKTTGS